MLSRFTQRPTCYFVFSCVKVQDLTLDKKPKRWIINYFMKKHIRIRSNYSQGIIQEHHIEHTLLSWYDNLGTNEFLIWCRFGIINKGLGCSQECTIQRCSYHHFCISLNNPENHWLVLILKKYYQYTLQAHHKFGWQLQKSKLKIRWYVQYSLLSNNFNKQGLIIV